MARKPENVHVYIYRKSDYNEYEYAIFQRADNPEWWQGVSGGVEDGETVEQAALREANEEAGIPLHTHLYRLDSISYLPSSLFSECNKWGKDVVVCPMYHYAIPHSGDIVFSEEHNEVRWLKYEEAVSLVYFHDQKNALWELNERLLRGNLVRTL